MNNLASDYLEKGDVLKSIVLNEKALHSRIKVLGENTKLTLCSMDKLAFAYYKNFEFEKSIALFERLGENSQ